MSKPFVVGWDIGGAHLKAALLNDKGEIINILQLPCPLWKGLDQLETAIKDALVTFKIELSGAGSLNIQHAVTMTGELADLFPNRHTGVIEISTLVAKLLGDDTFIYAANAGFVKPERVSRLTSHIASTNWHASASALAMHVDEALLLDIGSTTTDIIAIEKGKVSISGLTDGLSDSWRMQADSLVYTGVVRTPVMALAQKLPFEGTEINVAAEYFATMADVYRLTGELADEYDMAETADGKGKSELESARRLARMIGHDVENKPLQTWKNLAETCRSLQINQIKSAVLKHLKPNMTIIGAGAGSFLVKIIADDLGREFMHVWEPISMRLAGLPSNVLIGGHAGLTKKRDLDLCFSAFAVAFLAKNQWLRRHA
jgi:probable H4MPT-linked C1 transfer pathway protein